jgi:hypothetical protein
LDILKENLEVFSKKEQIYLLQYQYDLQTFFSFTQNRVALFVRVGYGEKVKYKSLRKNLDDLII